MTKRPYLLAALAVATLACTGQVHAQYAPYAPAGKHDAGATTTNLVLTPDRQADDEQAFFFRRPIFRSFSFNTFNYGFGGFGYSSFRFYSPGFYSPGFAFYQPFCGPYFSYYSFGPVFYPISTVVIEQPLLPRVIHPVQPPQPVQPEQPAQPGQPQPQPGQPGQPQPQPGQPADPKFKYDGGPTNPVPLPQPQPQPKDANPQPEQPTQPRQNVSLPSRPTPRLVYPAYGEHLPRR